MSAVGRWVGSPGMSTRSGGLPGSPNRRTSSSSFARSPLLPARRETDPVTHRASANDRFQRPSTPGPTAAPITKAGRMPWAVAASAASCKASKWFGWPVLAPATSKSWKPLGASPMPHTAGYCTWSSLALHALMPQARRREAQCLTPKQGGLAQEAHLQVDSVLQCCHCVSDVLEAMRPGNQTPSHLEVRCDILVPYSRDCAIKP